MTPKHIQQIIEENRARRAPFLDLCTQSLRQVPEEIRELTHLQRLLLVDNAIQTLPEWLAQLHNLATLDLSRNQLSRLPAEITQLHNLTSLGLSFNKLSTLPVEITQLRNLTRLYLSHNQLSTLPAEIAQLHKLTRLYLSGNQFSTLPSGLAQLHNLTELNLDRNQLSTLPAEIAQLHNLTELNLDRNQLSTLPAEIAQLQNLTKLDLSSNQFSTLPAEITQLHNLTALYLWNNKLSTLPAAIAQLHDLRALALKGNPLETPPLASLGLDRAGFAHINTLRAWFRDAATQGLEPIFEAKLLILGEGGAGKTSLAWRLINPSGELPNQEQSTEGIDVWRKDLDCVIEGAPQNIRLNLWDFGGQDIYHATHQFFLSHNALYVLVADTRRDDTDFFWWLSIVEKLGGDSPLLLVKNERDERVLAIDEGALFKRFHTNLQRVVATNLSTKRGLEPLLDEIRHQVRKLKHIGQLYPKLWKTVRETLEARPEPTITKDRYLHLCRDAGLQDDSAEALISLLHNLGVCLYFPDVPVLAKTLMLKPSWATEAVYRVLDDRAVQLQTGRFTLADVQRIWQTPKKVRHCRFADCLMQHQWQPADYQHMHHELLAMMQKFELCYELPNGAGYIAPSLLEVESKKYDFPPGGLVILYDYTGFMPKGLTGHLLVRRFEWIEDQRTRAWRYGAVLTYRNTRAEIIENRERREFSIRLSGDNCRDMATVLMDELDTIHGRFKDLDLKISIPCQCGRTPQWGFDLEVLRDAANHHRPVQCQQRGCFEMKDAEQILNGVFTPSRMEKELNAAARRFNPTQATSRGEALNVLKTLSNAQFAELVFVYEAPEEYLPGKENPTVQQAIALLKYAKQQDGSYDRLLGVLADCTKPVS